MKDIEQAIRQLAPVADEAFHARMHQLIAARSAPLEVVSIPATPVAQPARGTARRAAIWTTVAAAALVGFAAGRFTAPVESSPIADHPPTEAHDSGPGLASTGQNAHAPETKQVVRVEAPPDVLAALCVRPARREGLWGNGTPQVTTQTGGP